MKKPRPPQPAAPKARARRTTSAEAADAAAPPPPPTVIAADLQAWLDEAIRPLPPDPALQTRVKRALMRRIAADSTPRHLTVQAAETASWRPFGPGLTIKVLHRDGDTLSYLVRLAPGASLPAHRHPVDEECVVLEGAVKVGALTIAAGGYHLGRRDLPHDRLESPTGALIFLRGAVPEAALAL